MKKKKHIVAIIPSRYGSTRLQGKPLVDLCGKPMIQRVVEQARQSSLVDDIIVATDDRRIASAVASFGGKAVMTPSEIETGSDRIAFVARSLPDADIVVNLQGDEPLIDPRAIDEAIKPAAEHPEVHVATLVKKIEATEDVTNPNVVKAVLDENGYAIYFSRSPIPHMRGGTEVSDWYRRYPYYKHLGLYVFRRDFLLTFSGWEQSPLEQVEKLEQLRIIEHGFRIKATVTRFDSIPVDTAEDADRVRSILKQPKMVDAV